MNICELTSLVDLHGKSIYNFCRKLALNDADDLYQDTFLKASEICHKINKYNNPKSFLISIAVGVWRNNKRKYANRQRLAPVTSMDNTLFDVEILDTNCNVENIVISNETSSIVQNLIGTLNENLKVPLYMFYTANMSISDIANTLNIPQGTVKSRLYKAKRILKNSLEELQYEKL